MSQHLSQQKLRRALMRTFLATCVVVIGIFIGTYFYFSQIVSYLLEHQLRDLGLRQIQFTLGPLSTKKLQLRELKFQHTSDAYLARVKMSALSVQPSLSLEWGRLLKVVQIDQVQVQLERKEGNTLQAADSIPAKFSLPQLPFQDLRIGKLIVKHPDSEKALQLRVDLSSQDSKWHMRSEVRRPDAKNLFVEVTLQPSGRFGAVLRDQEKNLITQISGAITPEDLVDGETSLQVQMDLEFTSKLLRELGFVEQQGIRPSGNVQFSLRGKGIPTSLAHFGADISGEIQNLDVQFAQGSITPECNITFGGNITQQRVELHFEAKAVSFPLQIKGDMRHSFPNSTGELSIDCSPYDIGLHGLALSSFKLPDVEDLIFDAGLLTCSGVFAWGENDKRTASLSLENGALRYGKVKVSGLESTISFPDLAEPIPTEVSSVRVKSIDFGIPISNLETKASLIRGKAGAFELRLQGTSFEIFGGVVRNKSSHINLSGKPSTILLDFEGVQLEEILKLYDQSEIRGSGALKGVLPVSVSANGIVISDGRVLSEDPGGFLSYKRGQGSQSLAGSDPTLKFVFEALENYQYDSLVIDLNYASNGDLELNSRISGKNPDLNKGRRINVNLNVQENIPALLKSLQTVKNIEEGVTKALQQGKLKLNQ